MSVSSSKPFSRRTFLRGASALGSAGALTLGYGYHSSAQEAAVAIELPQRVLGKTKQQVSTLALGTWPCGRSEDIDTAGVSAMVNEAIDLGINFIDTAHNYGRAEEAIGHALGNRRDEVFLTTKVWADTKADARQSLEESYRALRTDRIDLVYLHSVGNRDVETVRSTDGSLNYLLRQKEMGRIRFVGISGHSMVKNFVPILESGEIDVVMMAMNFVDRYIYGFEQQVLPVANRLQVGVACMKVFGGIKGGFGAADGPNPGPEMDTRYLEQAIRYALGLPGVATLVIGPHTIDQLRQNAQLVSRYKPLTEQEQAELAKLGQSLAQNWGPHYGPVA